MNHALIAWRILLTTPLGFSLTGCIMVPIPEHGQLGPRDPVKRDMRQWLRESKPTREDVLLVLGGPETHTIDGQRCIYTWARIGGYWMTGGGYSGAAGPIESRHFLLITFDENDRVESVEESDRTLFSGFKSWSINEGNLLESPSEQEAGKGPMTPDRAAQMDAVPLEMHAIWWANSEGNSWRHILRGDTGENGHLTLTSGTIEFRMPSHSAEKEHRRIFAYSELAECRVKKSMRSYHVVIRTRTGDVHAFTLWRPRPGAWIDIGSVKAEDHEIVCSFLNARIAEQRGTLTE